MGGGKGGLKCMKMRRGAQKERWSTVLHEHQISNQKLNLLKKISFLCQLELCNLWKSKYMGKIILKINEAFLKMRKLSLHTAKMHYKKIQVSGVTKSSEASPKKFRWSQDYASRDSSCRRHCLAGRWLDELVTSGRIFLSSPRIAQLAIILTFKL